jgi:putative protease
MNSKDMCMIEHLQKFVDLGIKALKIEGRNKSEYYTAVTVRAYRNALDELKLPESERNTAYWKEEVEKTSHRDFSYGFYFGNPYRGGQTYTSSSYIRSYDVVGIIRSYDAESKTATVEQRNKFSEGDLVECFGPKGRHFELTVKDLRDEDNNKIDSAPHPQQTVKLHMEENAEPYFILRKKVERGYCHL